MPFQVQPGYRLLEHHEDSLQIRFNKNGAYSTGSRAAGTTSGKYGRYSSQKDAGSADKWKVGKGELYISEGYGQLAQVRTVVKLDSNGYPIIVTDGVEYSQCR